MYFRLLKDHKSYSKRNLRLIVDLGNILQIFNFSSFLRICCTEDWWNISILSQFLCQVWVLGLSTCDKISSSTASTFAGVIMVCVVHCLSFCEMNQFLQVFNKHVNCTAFPVLTREFSNIEQTSPAFLHKKCFNACLIPLFSTVMKVKMSRLRSRLSLSQN